MVVGDGAGMDRTRRDVGRDLVYRARSPFVDDDDDDDDVSREVLREPRNDVGIKPCCRQRLRTKAVSCGRGNNDNEKNGNNNVPT